LAFEVLKKPLNDETKVRSRKNLVKSRLFSQMLEETIRKYQNRSIETAQVIQELIDLAHQTQLVRRNFDRWLLAEVLL